MHCFGLSGGPSGICASGLCIMGRRRKGTLSSARQDELIAKLVPDPANVPHYKVVVGYCGKADAPGLIRIYCSLDLKDALEVAAADVVHSASLGLDGAAARPTMYWL